MRAVDPCSSSASSVIRTSASAPTPTRHTGAGTAALTRSAPASASPSPPRRSPPLRLAPRSRSGDHQRPSPSYGPPVVTPPYFHPHGCQIGGASGIVITTSDCYALRFSEEPQAAHAGSGDPHEVDRAGIHRGKQVH